MNGARDPKNLRAYPITDSADLRVAGSLSPTMEAMTGNALTGSQTAIPFFLIIDAISSRAPCRVLFTLDRRPCSRRNVNNRLDEKAFGRLWMMPWTR